MVRGPEILGQRGDNLVLRSFLVTGNYASRPAGSAAQNLHCQVPESASSVKLCLPTPAVQVRER
jgi:hypothetical protein